MQSFPPECAKKYRPVRRIAAGGHGEVWEAEQLALGRRVAVKVCLDSALDDPEAVKRFAAEARISASLAHPNVVQVIDHGTDGAPWIAFELVEGESLRQRLADGALDPAEALDLIVQVAQALDAAHAKGVLHRDVKPDNLITAADGRVQVADFGIALASGARTVKTRTGVILGTPAYIAPEQITGSPASVASDVYALGVTAFELLTGAPPYQGNIVEVLDAHVQAPVPKASARRRGLPAQLDRVLERALAKAPEERFRSARDLAAAFTDLRGALASGAPVKTTAVATRDARTERGSKPTIAAVVAPPPPRRAWWAVALAAVVALGLAAVEGKREPVVVATPSASAPAAPRDALEPLREELTAIADRNNMTVLGPSMIHRPVTAFLAELARFRDLHHAARNVDERSPDRLVFLAPAAQMAINVAAILATRELARNAHAEQALELWRKELGGAKGSARALADGLAADLLDLLKRERTLRWRPRTQLMLDALDALVARFERRPPEPVELIAAIDLLQAIALQLNEAVWVEWYDAANLDARPRLHGRACRHLATVLVPLLHERSAAQLETMPHLDRLLMAAVDLANAPDTRPTEAGTAGVAVRQLAASMMATTRWRPSVLSEAERAAQLSYRSAITLGWMALERRPTDDATGSSRLALALVRDWCNDANRVMDAAYSGERRTLVEDEAWQLVKPKLRSPDRLSSRLRVADELVKARPAALVAADRAKLRELANRGIALVPLLYAHHHPEGQLRLYFGIRQISSLSKLLEDRETSRRVRQAAARAKAGPTVWVAPMLRAEFADAANIDRARLEAAEAASAAVGALPDPGSAHWSAVWTAYLLVEAERAKALRDVNRRGEACALLESIRARLPRLHYLLSSEVLTVAVEELLQWRAKRCDVADPFLELLKALRS